MAQLTRDLAAMLNAGWTLPRLLSTVAKQADDPRIAAAFAAIGADLEKNVPVEQALLGHRTLFGTFFCRAVAAGESSSTLPKLMSFMPEYYERNAVFTRNIRQRLRFPLLVIAGSLGVIAAMLALLVPQAFGMVASAPGPLPPITKAVLSIGHLIGTGVAVAITVLTALVAATLLLLLWRNGFAMAAARLAMSRKFELRTFFGSFSMLQLGGAEFSTALDLSLEVIKGSSFYRKLILIGEPGKGPAANPSLSHALKESGFFSKPVLDLFEDAVRKQNGGDLFRRLADFYQEEIETRVTVFSMIIVPVVVAISGLLGLTVLLSLYVPLHRMH